MAIDSRLIAAVRDGALPLSGEEHDYDPLMDRIGGARLVLLGEATHGTHEFYRERARITQRLIEDKGFAGMIIEGDWPDAYRVNRYVRGLDSDPDADAALSGFRRFPAWMWRNVDVLELVAWLRAHNQARIRGPRAGFYGMDLYSLHGSIEAVLGYLDRVDPEAAKRARYRYGCFEHFGEDPQSYGYAASFDLSQSCEDEVVRQLTELRAQAEQYLQRDGWLAEDEYFAAEQNARLIKNAEEYYRSMFRGRISSWNLRDRHMAETVEALLNHLDRQMGQSKLVIWAHNSHLGDARATEMGRSGELNVGQLLRERFGSDAVSVGFSTFTGTVTAASDWGRPAQRKVARPALENSYERLFHETGLGNFMLIFGRDKDMDALLRRPRLQRAIGVIYLPETERISHYFTTSLTEQLDALIHFDQTQALQPLERTSLWERGELPETYPTTL